MPKLELSKKEKEELKYFQWKIEKDNETQEEMVVITGLTKEGKKIAHLVIPDCVTEIARNSFMANQKNASIKNPIIRTVKFGKNLKVIGVQAFYGCENLRVFDFEDAVSLKEVKRYSLFAGAVKEFRFPPSLEVLDHAIGTVIAPNENKGKLYLPKSCRIVDGENQNYMASFEAAYEIIRYEGAIETPAEFRVENIGAAIESQAEIKLTEEDKKQLRYFKWKIGKTPDGSSRGVMITGLSKQGKGQEIIVIPDCVYEIAPYSFHKEFDFHTDEEYEKFEEERLTKPQILAVVLGKNLEVIGEGAFSDNQDLECIDFSRAVNLKIIKHHAFDGIRLKGTTLPKNLKMIEENAFSNLWDENKYAVNIPKSCLAIGAFSKVFELKQYDGDPDFTEDVEKVESLRSLEKAREKERQERIRDYSEYEEEVRYEDTRGEDADDAQDAVLRLPSKRYVKTYIKRYMKYFDYDEDLENHGFYVIKDFNENLKKSKRKTLVFPDFITKYWAKATFDQSFSKAAQGKKWDEDYDDMFYSKAKQNLSYVKKLVLSRNLLDLKAESFCGCDALRTVTLARCKMLKTIPSMAFCATGITTVVIPKNVESIEEKAFYECHNLKSVALEKGSKLKYIQAKAFANCKNLEIVDLSNAKKLMAIGAYAFGADAQGSLVYTNGKIRKVKIENPKRVDLAENMFGSGIAFEMKGNAVIPDVKALKNQAKLQEEQIKQDEQARMKAAWEREKERDAEQLKKIQQEDALAEKYQNLAEEYLSGTNGKPKDLDMAIKYYELSYKTNLDPYVGTRLEECRQMKRKGVVSESVPTAHFETGNPQQRRENTAQKAKNEASESNKRTEVQNGGKRIVVSQNHCDIVSVLQSYDDGYQPTNKLETRRKKAFREHIEKSICAGKSEAIFWEFLGRDFERGWGCYRNDMLAIQCYEKANSLGRSLYTETYKFLGDCYSNGVGVAKDDQKAFDYYNRIYTKSIANFNGERDEAKERMDRLLAENASLAAGSGKPQILIEDFCKELKNRLEKGSGIGVTVKFNLSEVVNKYPSHLSYINCVTLIVEPGSNYVSLAGSRDQFRTHENNYHRALDESGLSSEFVDSFNFNDTSWSKDTMFEMEKVVAARDRAAKADETARDFAAYDIYKNIARPIIEKTWGSYKKDYEIVAEATINQVSMLGRRISRSMVETENVKCRIKTYQIKWK